MNLTTMTIYRAKQIAKYGLGLPLALATAGLIFVGSCTSHKDDLPPFYINKTGNSYGICIGGRINLEKDAEFNGLTLSSGNKNAGKINGANISLFLNRSIGTNSSVNGLELSLAGNIPIKENNLPARINGVQASIIVNMAREESKGLQIGLFNWGYNKKNIPNKSMVLNPLGAK